MKASSVARRSRWNSLADWREIRFAAAAVFEQSEIEIVATLGMGEAASEAWGCDLSEEYVRINADYTT